MPPFRRPMQLLHKLAKTMPRAHAPIVIMACMFSPGSLSAQDEPPVRLGERVRVRPLSSFIAVGTLRRIDADSLSVSLATGGGIVTFSTRDVQSLEVSDGRHNRAFLGGGIGFGLGVALGVAFVEIDRCILGCEDVPLRRHVGAALAGGFVGALLGAAVGSLFSSEHWQSVSLSVPSHPFHTERWSFGLTIAH